MKRSWSYLTALLLVCSLLGSLGLATRTAAAAPAWDGNNHAYTTGNLVTYNGLEYRCLQSHTSQLDWTPAAVASLWTPTGGSSNPTATTPPQATATAGPQPTATQPPNGSCTAAAWSAASTYVKDNLVSYGGKEWRARWWTQSDTPGTTGDWGVWEFVRNCGTTNPTATPRPTTNPTATPIGPTATPRPTINPTATPINPTATPVNPTVTPGPNGSKRIIGYFAEWGVYTRNYHVKNIVTSGSASKLTHINYAFGNVVNSRCALGDTYADYDRAYSAADSVDGVADTWDTGALRGSFNQLRKLKVQYPNIKVMISLGGWTWSAGFSDAALPANRSAFVKSCIDLFIKDPRWAGVFDGIDIDWEYPGACGNTCNFRPEDTQNFTALLAEFRSQLNAVRPGLQLSIAAPAGADKINKIEVNKIHQSLDFINVMTYDFHGAWENTTNFNANLYTLPADPATGNTRVSVDSAVNQWLNGGTPSNKLVVGVPFYGRGWTGVSSANNGLWQSSAGAAPPSTQGGEAGIEDYKVLKAKGFPRFTSGNAGEAWLYNGTQFWTYDDAPIMATKMQYIKSRNLGGAMFWELSGDTTNGELINALYTNR